MVPSDQFFVFSSGRWRGLDTLSGRVDGWGHAKFLVARRGKLEAVRSRPVLAALRALADKKPSAAKEGPQLPYKFPPVHESKERDGRTGCDHHCCHSGNSCTSKLPNNKTSIAIQCEKIDLTTHAQKTDLTTTVQHTKSPTKKPGQITKIIDNSHTDRIISKRKRDNSSSEELFHSKIVTVATVHSSKPEIKRARLGSSPHKSSGSDTVKSSLRSPRLQLRRPGRLKRKHSSRNSPILKSKSDKRDKHYHSKAKRLRKNSSDENGLRRSTRNNISIVISSDDSDLESDVDRISKKRRSLDEPIRKDPKRTTNTSIDEPVKKPDSKQEECKDKSKKHIFSPKRTTENDEPVKSGPDPKRTQKSSKDDRSKRKLGPRRTIRSSSDEQIESDPKRTLETSKSDPNKRKIGPKRTIERSSSVEEIYKPGPKRTIPKFSSEVNKDGSQLLKRSPRLQKQQKGSKNYEASQVSQCETRKELLIEERDVEILRLFLQKHYPDEVLLRFDTDDEYKMMHFYRINPLVNIERCPRIARMIQDRQKEQLVDFASKLGLRSVSETSSVQRYKMRKRERRQDNVNSDTDIENKENVDQPIRNTKNLLYKGLKESLKRSKGKSEREDKSDDTIDSVELSSDDEIEEEIVKKSKPKEVSKRPPLNEFSNLKDPTVVSKIVKKPRPKAVSKRPPLNEYSNLEDHAIVSWVSVGGRASCVNGNRLWRELQEQYLRLTGHNRTWHSLRNRYLRYILPRLGALALPPSLQTRLRAAAATGEIKGKRRDPKRNSIFKQPARGAASRRIVQPPSSEEDTREEREDEKEEPTVRNPVRAGTPRYSDVTRQFAQRHRYSSDQSSNKSQERKSKRVSLRKPNSPTDKSKNRTSAERSTNKSPRKSRNDSPKEKSKTNTLSNKCNDKSSNNSRKSRNRSNNKSANGKSRNDSSSDQSSRNSSADQFKNKSPNDRPSKKSNKQNEKFANTSMDRSENRNGKPTRKQSPSPRRNSRSESSSESSSHERPTRSKSLNQSPYKNKQRSDSNSSSSDYFSPNTSKRKSSRRKSSSESSNSSFEGSNSGISYRSNSPDQSNLRKSHRTNTITQSDRRKSNRTSPASRNRNTNRQRSSDSSERALPLNKRKSNRINSPELNRRKSNRVKSPIKPNKTNTPGESPRRNQSEKSPSGSMRKRNRVNSPESRNISLRSSARKSGINDMSHGDRNVNDSGQKVNKNSQIKSRTRKLFNPKMMM